MTVTVVNPLVQFFPYLLVAAVGFLDSATIVRRGKCNGHDVGEVWISPAKSVEEREEIGKKNRPMAQLQ
jgi:hypothetical protein